MTEERTLNQEAAGVPEKPQGPTQTFDFTLGSQSDVNNLKTKDEYTERGHERRNTSQSVMSMLTEKASDDKKIFRLIFRSD